MTVLKADKPIESEIEMLKQETIWAEELIELERENWTLGKLLKEKSRKNKDRTFLLFEDKKVSFEQFNEKANRLANGLMAQGICKGDKIALMLPNCPEFLYLWFGIAKAGAVMVPINVSWKGDLLQYVLNHSDAKALIVEDELYPQVVEALESARKIQQVFLRAEKGVHGEDVRLLNELFHVSAEEPNVTLTPHDPYEIMYTSGTTGRSKGVVRWSEYTILRGLRTVQYMGYTGDDILYTCLPLFHGNAQNLTVLPALLANARLALGKRFSASSFWKEIRGYGATVFNFVGTMIPILHKQEQTEMDALNQVRMARGGGIPSEIWKSFEKRFGLTLVETYGTTEGGSIWNMPGGKIGSLGKPPYFNEARIVDEADNKMPPNRTGELVIRPRDHDEKWVDYYKDPEATREKLRGGWFRTGDLAYEDEEGWFYFVDRQKDVIRRRGENISAWEVEVVINSHPKVLESACIGVPSELGENDVMVFVVPKPSMSMNPHELIAYCQDRMAYFMVPRYVKIMGGLPKTPTERVEKYKLKELWSKEDVWDREG